MAARSRCPAVTSHTKNGLPQASQSAIQEGPISCPECIPDSWLSLQGLLPCISLVPGVLHNARVPLADVPSKGWIATGDSRQGHCQPLAWPLLCGEPCHFMCSHTHAAPGMPAERCFCNVMLLLLCYAACPIELSYVLGSTILACSPQCAGLSVLGWSC